MGTQQQDDTTFDGEALKLIHKVGRFDHLSTATDDQLSGISWSMTILQGLIEAEQARRSGVTDLG